MTTSRIDDRHRLVERQWAIARWEDDGGRVVRPTAGPASLAAAGRPGRRENVRA